MPTLHCVPRSLIEKHGATAAYLLVKLSYRQRGAKRFIGGKSYFYSPLGRRAQGGKASSKFYKPLADELPWLKSTDALHHAISNLAALNKIVIERKYKTYKTNHYHIPSHEKLIKLTDSENQQRWFDVEDAKAAGINCALVLNLIYREFHLWGRDGFQYLSFSRSRISRDLGLPLSTVSDVFKKLERLKFLSSCITSRGKAFRLLVTNECTLKGNGHGRCNVAEPVAVKMLDEHQFTCISEQLLKSNIPLTEVLPCPLFQGYIERVNLRLQKLTQAKLENRKRKAKRVRPRGRKHIDEWTCEVTRGVMPPVDRDFERQEKEVMKNRIADGEIRFLKTYRKKAVVEKSVVEPEVKKMPSPEPASASVFINQEQVNIRTEHNPITEEELPVVPVNRIPLQVNQPSNPMVVTKAQEVAPLTQVQLDIRAEQAQEFASRLEKKTTLPVSTGRRNITRNEARNFLDDKRTVLS